MTNEEIERGISFLRTAKKEHSTYIILIDNNLFITRKDKCVWKRKCDARSALRQEISEVLGIILEERLFSDPNFEDLYKNTEYIHRFEKFESYLIENNILEYKKFNKLGLKR